MTLSFKPATREASFARIALTGPSGSGKTWTALTLAFALSDRVAVIDTERGSASKYVGLNGWQFDTVQPDSFSPLSLVATLGVAAGRDAREGRPAPEDWKLYTSPEYWENP